MKDAKKGELITERIVKEWKKRKTKFCEMVFYLAGKITEAFIHAIEELTSWQMKYTT